MRSIFVNEQLYGVIMHVCNMVLSYKAVYTYRRLNTVIKNQLQVYRKYVPFFKIKDQMFEYKSKSGQTMYHVKLYKVVARSFDKAVRRHTTVVYILSNISGNPLCIN